MLVQIDLHNDKSQGISGKGADGCSIHAEQTNENQIEKSRKNQTQKSKQEIDMRPADAVEDGAKLDHIRHEQSKQDGNPQHIGGLTVFRSANYKHNPVGQDQRT